MTEILAESWERLAQAAEGEGFFAEAAAYRTCAKQVREGGER